MLAVFQSIRDGVGCTTVAASVGWHLSRFRPKVFVTAIASSLDGLRCAYNIPPLPSDAKSRSDVDETIWGYNDRLVLACPAQLEREPDTVESLIAAVKGKGFSDIIVDIGHDLSTEADYWRTHADVVITVCESDHNALVRLSKYQPLPNEYVLLNKVMADSEAGRLATRSIRGLKSLAGKVLSFVVPRDEYAAQASFMKGPVVQLAAYSESARVISALGTWLTVYERKRG